MCGLVGVAGDLFQKDEAAIKRLLFFDYIRGSDATGLAAIGNDNSVKIAKLASDPITLFDSMKFKSSCIGTITKAFIGHNRAATRGGNTNFNAHPYEFDHIVGAHNGTLDAASWNAIEDAIGEKFAVDSQALYAAIAKLGIKETINLCYEGKDSATGAWSLVWFDLKENTLNFLRNKHRPMWYSFSEDFKKIYWASEWWMLDTMSRSINEGKDHPLYAEGKEQYKFFQTETDQHYKFDLPTLMNGGTKRPKPKVSKLAGKEPKPVAAASSGNFPMKPHGNGSGGKNTDKGSGVISTVVTTLTTRSTASSPKTTSHGKTQRSPDNVIHWLGMKDQPLAGYIKKDKFDELAKYGCSWCQADVEFGQTGITIYERDDLLLCPSCSGHDDTTDDTPSRIYATAPNFNSLRS